MSCKTFKYNVNNIYNYFNFYKARTVMNLRRAKEEWQRLNCLYLQVHHKQIG